MGESSNQEDTADISVDAEEIVALATHLERAAAEFYRAVAMTATTSAAQVLLLQLAEDEVRHEMTFAGLIPLVDVEAPAAGAPAKAASNQYWRKLLENGIYRLRAEGFPKVTGRMGIHEILRQAIAFENETIAFYFALRTNAGEARVRRLLDRILKEEVGHVLLMSGQVMPTEAARLEGGAQAGHRRSVLLH